MKVMVDENLPPAMAKALAALFAGKHEVVHLREKFGAAVKDTEWIGALNAEGHWVIISGDRRIAKNKAEQQAFKSSKLESATRFAIAPDDASAAATAQQAEILLAKRFILALLEVRYFDLSASA